MRECSPGLIILLMTILLRRREGQGGRTQEREQDGTEEAGQILPRFSILFALRLA